MCSFRCLYRLFRTIFASEHCVSIPGCVFGLGLHLIELKILLYNIPIDFITPFRLDRFLSLLTLKLRVPALMEGFSPTTQETDRGKGSIQPRADRHFTFHMLQCGQRTFALSGVSNCEDKRPFE